MTHWRRLRFWETSSLWPIWRFLLERLAKRKDLDLTIASLDGSLVPSFAFSDQTGYSGRHRRVGTKLSSVVDTCDLPLGIRLASGNTHDLTLAVLTLEQIKVGRRTRPDVVLADKGYDSQLFRRTLRERWVKANIPERVFRRRRKRGRPPGDDKVLGKQRFVVERTHGWFKSFRRLHFRFDYSMASFEALLHLAVIVVWVRRLVT